MPEMTFIFFFFVLVDTHMPTHPTKPGPLTIRATTRDLSLVIFVESEVPGTVKCYSVRSFCRNIFLLLWLLPELMALFSPVTSISRNY